MVYATLLCWAMLGDQNASAASAPSDLAAYQAAQKAAGRDANAQVRLALWCEAHGLTAERVKHLGLAVLSDPSNMLRVGFWAWSITKGNGSGPTRSVRPCRMIPSGKPGCRSIWSGGPRRPNVPRLIRNWLWCEQNGLKDQAVAHFHQALRLDPSARSPGSTWGTRRSAAGGKSRRRRPRPKHEAQEQQRANKHWRPILEKLRAKSQEQR